MTTKMAGLALGLLCILLMAGCGNEANSTGAAKNTVDSDTTVDNDTTCTLNGQPCPPGTCNINGQPC